MTKKEMLEAAESNSMNYCMHRGVAKAAFVEGAMWALQYGRNEIDKARNALDVDYQL